LARFVGLTKAVIDCTVGDVAELYYPQEQFKAALLHEHSDTTSSLRRMTDNGVDDRANVTVFDMACGKCLPLHCDSLHNDFLRLSWFDISIELVQLNS
jgi:hypothetical protein